MPKFVSKNTQFGPKMTSLESSCTAGYTMDHLLNQTGLTKVVNRGQAVDGAAFLDRPRRSCWMSRNGIRPWTPRPGSCRPRAGLSLDSARLPPTSRLTAAASWLARNLTLHLFLYTLSTVPQSTSWPMINYVILPPPPFFNANYCHVHCRARPSVL